MRSRPFGLEGRASSRLLHWARRAKLVYAVGGWGRRRASVARARMRVRTVKSRMQPGCRAALPPSKNTHTAPCTCTCTCTAYAAADSVNLRQRSPLDAPGKREEAPAPTREPTPTPKHTPTNLEALHGQACDPSALAATCQATGLPCPHTISSSGGLKLSWSSVIGKARHLHRGVGRAGQTAVHCLQHMQKRCTERARGGGKAPRLTQTVRIALHGGRHQPARAPAPPHVMGTAPGHAMLYSLKNVPYMHMHDPVGSVVAKLHPHKKLGGRTMRKDNLLT